MALRKFDGHDEMQSESRMRARRVSSSAENEKKILTTFSIEPSFKAELEDLFSSMGLGWAAGVRFALREFAKKYSEE